MDSDLIDFDAQLTEAARAVIERWDSPSWKDTVHTAAYINRMRNVLDARAAAENNIQEKAVVIPATGEQPMSAASVPNDLTDAQIDALDTFVLHAMAPCGRQSVRDFARAVLAAQRSTVAPEGGNAGRRGEKTVIGLDYDGTITRDPDMWFALMKMMQAHGHEVHIVTMRHGIEAEMCRTPMDARFLKGADGVHFTGNSETFDRDAKLPHMESKGIRVDIWIDDNPKAVHLSARQIWGWCTKPGDTMVHSAPELVGSDTALAASGKEHHVSHAVMLAALRATQEACEVSQCPWCGVWGASYAESSPPADCCHHEYHLPHWGSFAEAVASSQMPGAPEQPDAARWRAIAKKLEKIQWTGAGYEYRLFVPNPTRIEDVGQAVDEAFGLPASGPKTALDARAAGDELLQAMRHIEGAAMDIGCERRSIRDGARAAIAAYLGRPFAVEPAVDNPAPTELPSAAGFVLDIIQAFARFDCSEQRTEAVKRALHGYAQAALQAPAAAESAAQSPVDTVAVGRAQLSELRRAILNEILWDDEWKMIRGNERVTARVDAILGVAAAPSAAPGVEVSPPAANPTSAVAVVETPSGIKIRCGSRHWARKVQILLRDEIGLRWSDDPKMAIPWNTSRLLLVVRQGTAGDWFLSWATPHEFDAIPFPEWDAQPLIAAAPRNAA